MTSNLRHVVVTGPPGIGKTTFLQKVISSLHKVGVPCQGFVTQEVRQGGRRVGFDVINLEGKSAILSRVKPESGGKRECRVGQYVVDVPAFESVAIPLLRTQISRKHILVLDEIGKMEMFSQGFVSGVRQVMSQTTTVLITIPVPKGKPIPLVEEIRNRKDILLINLSRENRDDVHLQEQVMKTLTSSLQNQ